MLHQNNFTVSQRFQFLFCVNVKGCICIIENHRHVRDNVEM